MAIPNARDILFVPGKLCINPIDLTTAYPHGGTGLGEVKNIILRPAITNYEIKAEEFGSETIDIVYGGESWVLGAILRSFDNDAINTLFANTAVGSTTRNRLIQHSGTNRAGHLLSSRSVVLVFSPNDLDNHPMTILYKALPLVQETAEINLQLNLEFNIAIIFAGIRDGSDRVIKQGLRADLSL